MSGHVLAVALSVALVSLAAPCRAKTTVSVSSIDEAEALLEAWQLEAAKQAAEQILVSDPRNPQAWALAGRVQHARGEHVAALSLLRAAVQAGVADAGSILPLVEASAAYATQFQTHETPHFKIRYLNKDEITASYAAPVLEAAYHGIGTALEFLPAEAGEKIVVEIYPDARGLAGATGLTISEIETSGTIAVCKFHRLMITSPLATADGYDWADTLAHEFTHLIISKKSHNTIPIWLHEGIAKYFESGWRGPLGQALSPYSEKLLADAVRTQKLITYQQMHPSMAKLPSQDAAALAFAEVFTTIEYLVRERGVPSVPRVLTLTAHGASLEEALRQTYGSGLGGIEAAWRRYLLHRPFREAPGAKAHPIHLAANDKESPAARPLEPMQDREVHDLARLGELLQLRGHTQAAMAEYEKAYNKSGVAYATLVYRLARAYVDSHREADALTVLNRALAVHADESDLRLLAGRARLARGDFDGARRDFEVVRLHNPFVPEIHEALRQLYEAKGDKEGAAREAHFFELSRAPRATRTYEPPPAFTHGSTRLDLIAVPFGDLRVDGATVAAPIWDFSLAPGQHRIEMTLADGSVRSEAVTLAVGETRTVILQ